MPEATTIEKLFSSIAPRYDFLNHFLSLNIDSLWRQKLIARVSRAGHPLQILDLCTGTGDIALAFSRRFQDATVTALDLSQKMMDVGIVKAQKKNVSNRVRFIQGNAIETGLNSERFDAISMAFGLRNLPNVEKGIQEMHRLLRPGGKVLILEFAPKQPGVFGKLYGFYLRHLLPVVGGLISGSRDAYAYLATSIPAFLDPARVEAALTNQGFREVRAVPLFGHIAYIYEGVK